MTGLAGRVLFPYLSRPIFDLSLINLLFLLYNRNRNGHVAVLQNGIQAV